MFVDRVMLEVEAGKGGDGAVSFLREAFRPRGGPDGGDGGDGGSVILDVTPHRMSLHEFSHRPRYRAENGRPGGALKCSGRRGKDLVLRVPAGTLVYDEETDELVADLTEFGPYVLAHGGKGGRGNASFATALNQAPRVATRGTPGQKGRYRLELKLIAEVGLVGLPNAGKSTFISRVSKARPKIADYPFTTLVPNLGVATVDDDPLVLADIPGLIEGASLGKGLGDEFLRHVERTRVLLHLIDGAAPEVGGPEPADAYRTIRGELEAYPHADLASKPELVALNKIDALDDETLEARAREVEQASGARVFRISGVSGAGLQEVLRELLQTLRETELGAEAQDDPPAGALDLLESD